MLDRESATQSLGYRNVRLSPAHSLRREWVVEIVMLAAALMFLAGSFCFFDGLSATVLEIGEILFIVASCIYVIVGLVEMSEMCHASEPDEPVLLKSAFHEQMTYLVAATIFNIGCVLFWPGIYGKNKAMQAIGEPFAAWCFVTGSLGFVTASFWNAIQLPEAVGSKCWVRLTKLSLYFSIMGGVFFVTGSYLFSLDVGAGCASYKPVKLVVGSPDTGRAGKYCVSVTDQGTVLFIIGSFFYTVQSVLNCIKLCLRRCIKLNKHGYCEVAVDDEDDRLVSEHSTDRSMFDETE